MHISAFLVVLNACIIVVESIPVIKNGSSTIHIALALLDSIIIREQGVTVNPSVKTSVIEAGLLLMGLDEVLENIPLGASQKGKYESYLELVMSGLIPSLNNLTSDTTSPLDEFSAGTQLIKQYRKTGNNTFIPAIEILHQADQLRNRQQDGSYWYYVYHNVTTQDGLFSIPAFHSLYAREFNPTSAIAAYQTSTLQFSNIVEHCSSYPAGGLLYHGYDPTRSFPVWGNLSSRGHSQSIWARAVSWTCTGLLTILDVIPDIPATTVVRGQLIDIFTSLISAVVRAQDETSGAWWQVMEFPGREGNFLESSATGLFAHAILRGLRLGYLSSREHRRSIGEPSSTEQYKNSAKRAYDWLLQNALTDLGSGTLGYNLTVDVCSVNSTTDFDFYVAQPFKPESLLGEVGFILTAIEIELVSKCDLNSSCSSII